MKENKNLCIFSGGITMIITVLLFFLLTGNKHLVHWFALLFLLLPEYVFFGVLFEGNAFIRKGKKTFYYTGILTVLGLYWFAAIFSIILILIFSQSIKLLLLSQIILLFLSVMTCVLIILTANREQIDRK